MIIFAAYSAAETPCAFQWAWQLPKIAATRWGLDRILYMVPGVHASHPQTASRSVQSLLQGSRTWTTDRQTHTHRLCYIVYRNKPHLHCVTKNLSTFYFLNKSVKYLPILMLFATWNPQKIWHQKRICLPTLPVSCSHFTFGSSKKSISTLLLIRNSDYLRYLWIKRTVTVNVDLPTTSKKCHPTTLWT